MEERNEKQLDFLDLIVIDEMIIDDETSWYLWYLRWVHAGCPEDWEENNEKNSLQE